MTSWNWVASGRGWFPQLFNFIFQWKAPRVSNEGLKLLQDLITCCLFGRARTYQEDYLRLLLWIRIGSCNLSINSGLQAKDCDDFKNLAWNPFSSPPKRIFGETSHFIFSQFSFNIMQISECIHACTNAQYALFQFAVKIIAYTFYLLITIEAYYTILPLIQE